MRSMLLATTFVLAAAGCSKADKDQNKGATPGTAAAPTATAPTATAPTAPGATAPTAPGATAPGSTVTPPADVPASPVLGKPAPDFTLEAFDGKKVTLSSLKGKTVVLEWFNPGCPFVQRSHTKGSLVHAAHRAEAQGVVWLAINSGAEGKQGFEPTLNTEAATRWSLTHPILRDTTGEVGKAYGATNTPNMFVIDPAGTVVYAGAIDNSPDGEGASPAGGTLVNHVDAALADLAAGRPVATPLTKPYGCGVKYASS